MSHAKLSPSASGRWLQCPASVRLLANLPNEPSVYAQEGLDFHTLCELSARHHFLGSSESEYQADFLDWAFDTDDDWREDQIAYCADWIAYLEECLAEEEGATLLLEQRVETGIPSCWGTADVVIIYTNRIKVIDIKYGQGVAVSAEQNTQLMLYGLGALSLIPVKKVLQVRDVELVIWQPRLNSVSEYILSRKALRAWQDEILPIAELALSEDAPFGPSEDACRWCPVAGTCKARTDKLLAEDFGDPDLMSLDQLAEAYGRAKEMAQWAKDVADAALKAAYEVPGSLPGYKVVLSGGRRSIPNSELAIKALLHAGYKRKDVARESTNTLGNLDKLVGGADVLKTILGDLLVKSEGTLSLAIEGDPRPPADTLHSAKTDFAAITEIGEPT